MNYNKTKLIFLAILFFGIFGLAKSSWAATIYIDPTCPTSGDGTTMTCGTHGPFKTWTQVAWVTGNIYALKGGTSTHEMIHVGAGGTSENNRVVLTSYGTGQGAIDGSKVIPSNSWLANDPVAGTYSVTSQTSGGAIYEDGVPMKYTHYTSLCESPGFPFACCTGVQTASNCDPSHLGSGEVRWENGKIYYRPTSGTAASHTLEWSIEDGNGFGVCLDLGWSGNPSYITIDNLAFRRCRTAIGTIPYSSGWQDFHNNYITITNNTFDDNESAVAVVTRNQESTGLVIKNNTFTYNCRSIETGSSRCNTAGDGGVFSNADISNNIISGCSVSKNTGDQGLWWWNQYYGDAQDQEGIGLQNTVDSNVYQNTITGACCGYVNNICVNSSAGYNTKFYRNFVKTDMAAFINYASGTAFYGNDAYYNILSGGLKREGWYAALVLENGTGVNNMFNNTIVYPHNGATGAGWSNYVFKNNLWYALTIPANYIFGTDSVLTGDVYTNNDYYPGSTDYGWWYVNGGKTWATWIGLGHDTNSMNGTNPKFTNGSGTLSLPSDFTLLADSQLINAGTDVGLTSDYAGNPIVGLPDIGAYEYQGSSGDTTPPAAPHGLSVE